MRHQRSRRLPKFICVVLATFLADASYAHAACTLPYMITNGQPADASQIMANYNALAACIAAITNTPGGATNSLQYNAGSGTFGGIAPLTDGQFLIGSTGGIPAAANLTAGSGIAITNAPGNVTVSATNTAAGQQGSLQYNNGSVFAGLPLTDGQLAVGLGSSFSQTAKSTAITLTNSNLTATSSSTGYAGVLGTAVQSSGKYYFEFQNVSFANVSSGVGIANVNVPFTSALGAEAHGIGYQNSGGVYLNNSRLATIATYSGNVPVIGFAIDVTNKLLWIRLGASGMWNNSATADPALGTGGISYSAINSPVIYPATIFHEANPLATLAPNSSAWLGAAPIGFSPWSSNSSVSAVSLTGAASLSSTGVLTSNAKTAQSTPANPTGTTNTAAQVMMGLGGVITPGASGRVLFMISGDGFNSNAVGNGYIVQLRYGTGTAPANGAAVTGTAVGGSVKAVTAVTSSVQDIPFALQSMVTGLSVGTTYWYDVGLEAIGGGTANIENLSLTAAEM